MGELSEYVLNMTPTEFEKYSLEILKGFAEEENLSNFSIDHNVMMQADDGTYQIDIAAHFTALGTKFDVICECKRYSSPVTREKVVILADKVKSLGAHKGILISTSGYQSGAVQYAEKHGIALLQIYDRHLEFYSFADGNETNGIEYIYENLGEYYPKFYAQEWTGKAYSGKTIYPTSKMIIKLHEELRKLWLGKNDTSAHES